MIRICTPFYDTIHEEMSSSVRKVAAGDIKCEWATCRGTLIADSRNSLMIGASSALLRKKFPEIAPFDGFFFIDSDIEFTMNDFEAIIKASASNPRAIMCGAYMNRANPTDMCHGWMDSDGKWDIRPRSALNGEIIPVQWSGAGFMFVPACLLKELPYPWFHHRIIEHSVRGEAYASSVGEDVSLCMLARENGFDVLVHEGVVVKHLVPGRFMIESPEGVKPESKAAIINAELEIVRNTIYKHSVRARAYTLSGDLASADKERQVIEKFCKLEDAYKKLIADEVNVGSSHESDMPPVCPQ